MVLTEMTNASEPGRWLREPILHFALIGVILFAVYDRFGPTNKAGERIVVSQAVADDIARQHQARWNRPASEQELSSLMEEYVRDEILYREGQALGLDRDDPVIKRRVRQKLEIISEEQTARGIPTDAELSAYMTQNTRRLMFPATVSFEQVYFDGSKSVAELERAVAAARTALARGVDPARLGQPTMAALSRAQTRRCAPDARPYPTQSGPIASGMGAHLVRISAFAPATMPPLDAVRQQVAREWENERRNRSRSESYENLRRSYEVVIETKLAQARASQP
ncbi:MAG: peptidylprolyl isomerase [Proteobacteria bacterium]|nr:peptidylprolyl isomerase [Pseudomonadota bacterium]